MVHIHAEGPAFFAWLPKMFGKRVVVTVHGTCEIMLVNRKYADEVIVLSKGVQKYFLETYGRETHFIPNGVNRPEVREAKLITDHFGLEKDSYILFLGRLVPEKGIRYLVEAFKNVKTDKSIEMLQLLLRLGTFQLSDIFYNTVGGALGGVCYCVAMKARKRL